MREPEHETELRERKYMESVCIEPGCEYEGKPSVQGHCHTRLDDVTEAYITRLTANAERGLAQIKEIAGPEKYVEHLEDYYLSVFMNWQSAIDNLILLRRQNARLLAELRALGLEP